MSWKKHFRVVNSPLGNNLVDGNSGNTSAGHGTSAKFSSYLPEVYAGHPNRIQRYYQYQDMANDSDIAAALDTIADFCTQSEEQNDNPFEVNYLNDDANETEVKLIKEALTKWVRMNAFKSRLWKIFRDTAKNGDTFFLRDPENGEWLWLDHFSVEMVKVDEEHGKEPDEYIVQNLDINFKAKFASSTADLSQYRMPFGTTNTMSTARPVSNGTMVSGMFQMAGSDRDNRNLRGQNGATEHAVIDAEHIVHLSLSEGMDANWPFGQSILEPVFKTYKQKELLEDAVIIYRVQRAPERRVFKIDVGTMQPQRAKAHVEAIKNEIHQRRIPNRTGGGSSIMDAAYNPLSIVEDYFFAQSSEGRGSTVETLPGGDSLGEIGDLSFFTKKLARGLRIPSTYLSLGDDDSGNAAYNDGKLGSAMIQEFRFNKYCMRLQALLAPEFDRQFKWFLNKSGIDIDPALFELQFCPPQNFTKYRQIELDASQVQVYTSLQDNKRLSEQFKLKRFLNLTEEELLENETMWREENAEKLKKKTGGTPADTDPQGDLGSVGVAPPTDDFGMPGGDDLGGEDMGDGEGGDAAMGPDAGGDGGVVTPPGGANPGAPTI